MVREGWGSDWVLGLKAGCGGVRLPECCGGVAAASPRHCLVTALPIVLLCRAPILLPLPLTLPSRSSLPGVPPCFWSLWRLELAGQLERVRCCIPVLGDSRVRLQDASGILLIAASVLRSLLPPGKEREAGSPPGLCVWAVCAHAAVLPLPRAPSSST